MTVTEIQEFEESYLNECSNIAFDIETTGFETQEKITVIGFQPDFDDTVMLVNIDSISKSKKTIINNLEELGTDTQVMFFDSEKELLDVGLRKFIQQLSIRDQRLYGYNAETWGGGFDFPFLRTRFIKHNIDWYLGTNSVSTPNAERFPNNTPKHKRVTDNNDTDVSVYYVDIMAEVKKQFNTTSRSFEELSDEKQELFKNDFNLSQADITNNEYKQQLKTFSIEHDINNISIDNNGLDEAHNILCGCGIEDPFDSSKEAVEEYNDGNVAKVIYHCYTDILRTQCLFYLVMEYSSAQKPSQLKDSTYL